jgi:hypothetical protein
MSMMEWAFLMAAIPPEAREEYPWVVQTHHLHAAMSILGVVRQGKDVASQWANSSKPTSAQAPSRAMRQLSESHGADNNGETSQDAFDNIVLRYFTKFVVNTDSMLLKGSYLNGSGRSAYASAIAARFNGSFKAFCWHTLSPHSAATRPDSQLPLHLLFEMVGDLAENRSTWGLIRVNPDAWTEGETVQVGP